MSSERWLLFIDCTGANIFLTGNSAGRREVIMGLFDQTVSMDGDNISGGMKAKTFFNRP
jgi:hypothetical protein